MILSLLHFIWCCCLVICTDLPSTILEDVLLRSFRAWWMYPNDSLFVRFHACLCSTSFRFFDVPPGCAYPMPRQMRILCTCVHPPPARGGCARDGCGMIASRGLPAPPYEDSLSQRGNPCLSAVGILASQFALVTVPCTTSVGSVGRMRTATHMDSLLLLEEDEREGDLRGGVEVCERLCSGVD